MGSPFHWRRLALVAGAAILMFTAYGSVLTSQPLGINDDYQFSTVSRRNSPKGSECVGLRDQIHAQFPAGSPGRLVYLLPPPTPLAG